MTAESSGVHIKVGDVPDHVMKYLARDLLAGMRRFYEDPKNRAEYEAWKAEREAAK